MCQLVPIPVSLFHPHEQEDREASPSHHASPTFAFSPRHAEGEPVVTSRGSVCTCLWMNGNNQQKSDGIKSPKQTQCSLTECLLMSDETPKATSRKGVSTIFPEALMALQDTTIAKEIAEVDANNMPAILEVSFMLII